ncbi:MAG: MFS transporter [Rickettsiales bacterium]|nr:MAG: MFS transporter [Rickettsiales bacterium]
MALYLTQAILEIPTGGLGDRFGNKKCLIVAILFLIIGRSILLYDTNFPIVIFSNIIIGIGLTFLSGCEESLFYDNVKHLKMLDDYPKYKSMASSVAFFSFAISSFFAAYIMYNYDFATLLKMQVAVYLCLLFTMITIKDYKANNEKLMKLSSNYYNILKNSFLYLFKHTSLLKNVLFSIFSPFIVFIEYNAILYADLYGDNKIVGVLIGVDALIGSIIIFFLAKSFKNTTFKQLFLYQILTSFLLILGILVYKFPYSYIVMVLFFAFYFKIRDINFFKKQAIIPSKIRSTIISIESFLVKIMNSVYILLFGYISTKTSYKNGFIIAGILGFINCLIFYAIISKDKHLNKIDARY